MSQGLVAAVLLGQGDTGEAREGGLHEFPELHQGVGAECHRTGGLPLAEASPLQSRRLVADTFQFALNVDALEQKIEIGIARSGVHCTVPLPENSGGVLLS